MKDLINYNFYGYITEEMETSDNFTNNKFIEQKEIRSVVLEVGVDPENDIEYRIVLILSFTNRSGYEELVFGFSILDKNNQYVKGKESIYNREEVNKYLPKELQKSIVFFGKLKEMFKKLITMEKPLRFFIETYEDYKNEKLLIPYRNMIKVVLENGYMLKKEGLAHDKKKYFWEFIQATKQTLPEGYEPMDLSKIVKDEAYWQHRKELTMESVKRFLKTEEENKKVI